MIRNHTATPAERTAMSTIPATAIPDASILRRDWIRVGTLEGRLTATQPRPGGGVLLELRVGASGAVAVVACEVGQEVEVWRD